MTPFTNTFTRRRRSLPALAGLGLAAALLAAPALPAQAQETCGGRAVTIPGTDGNDTLSGTGSVDVFSTGAGNDFVSGLGDNDIACLGPGDDVFVGGDGNDRMVAATAQDGADTFVPGAGTHDAADYSVRTGTLNVSLDGLVNDGAAGEGDSIGADTEIVEGGSGADVLSGNLESQLELDGGPGNDTLNGGGGGFDTLVGADGDDLLDTRSTSGDDIEFTDDRLLGGPGNDTLHAGPGDDTLAGHNGADVLNGGAGVDTLTGDDNPNTTVGGPDELNGGSGDDDLRGDVGADTLNGGSGNDRLDGVAGNDTLRGGIGDDRLAGGDDNDTMVAEGSPDGADTFFGDQGVDTVSYAARTATQRVSVTIDNVANDGAAGEGDNIANADNVQGGQGPDRISGDTAANVLVGNGGNDVLNGVDGIRGNDRLNGGDGSDTCTADPNDRIDNCP